MPACLNLQCQVKKEPHRAAPNRKERQKRKIFIQLSEPFGLWLSLLIEGAPKSKGEASVDEVSLVKRCQQGDLDAFGILVEHYRVKAVRTAYLLTGRMDIAEDVAHEAFVQCYR